MQFWGDFGARGEDIWWESTSVLRIARFQTSFGMGIAICHRRKLGKFGGPQLPTRSHRKTSLMEGTTLDLRLPHGKIVIIL